MKRIVSLCLALVLLCSLLCVSVNAESAKREKVIVWHLWTGGMADSMDALATEFNASNDRYEVECLSVPDFQKINVAIASGEGPDLTDSWNSYVAQFASMGTMEPLDDYIANSNYDLSDFNQAALEACRYQGKLYAMPCNVNVIVMYYNKALLAAAGYTQAPKSLSEMIQVANDTTKLNDNGTLKTLGFPVWPLSNYRNYFSYALGGGFISNETLQPTINTDGNLLMLQAYYNYVNQFGVDAVSIFTSSGKTHDPTDPFLNGTQALRFDGPWTSGYFKELNLDVDWGVAYMPYADGHEDQQGRQIVSCSTFYVPTTAKCKDGAWEFMQYLLSEHGQTEHIIKNANLPVRTSLYQSDEYMSRQEEAAFFAEVVGNKNLLGAPNYDQSTDYNTLVKEQLEKCFAAQQTPEQTLENIQDQAKNIF